MALPVIRLIRAPSAKAASVSSTPHAADPDRKSFSMVCLLLFAAGHGLGGAACGDHGKIHSDFERGFIKAEVVYYQDLLDCGSYNGAKEKGLVRMEGKEYVVKDGDVILFRFNV